MDVPGVLNPVWMYGMYVPRYGCTGMYVPRYGCSQVWLYLDWLYLDWLYLDLLYWLYPVFTGFGRNSRFLLVLAEIPGCLGELAGNSGFLLIFSENQLKSMKSTRCRGVVHPVYAVCTPACRVCVSGCPCIPAAWVHSDPLPARLAACSRAHRGRSSVRPCSWG